MHDELRLRLAEQGIPYAEYQRVHRQGRSRAARGVPGAGGAPGKGPPGALEDRRSGGARGLRTPTSMPRSPEPAPGTPTTPGCWATSSRSAAARTCARRCGEPRWLSVSWIAGSRRTRRWGRCRTLRTTLPGEHPRRRDRLGGRRGDREPSQRRLAAGRNERQQPAKPSRGRPSRMGTPSARSRRRSRRVGHEPHGRSQPVGRSAGRAGDVGDARPDGHRDVEPRRTGLRHLQAAAAGPDRVPGRRDRGSHREPHHRPAALPGLRGP